MLAYGNLPSGPTFIFCILVLALSNGNASTEDTKPETALALYINNFKIFPL